MSKTDKNGTKKTAYNERFGATAAGSVDLKGSAGMPPLRQAAIPLQASRESETDRVRNESQAYHDTMSIE
jgi:hypothetical protein